MSQIKKFLLAAPLLVIGLASLTLVPVNAEGTSGGGSHDGTTTTSTAPPPSSSEPSRIETTAKTEDSHIADVSEAPHSPSPAGDDSRRKAMRSEAEQEIQDMRKDHKQHKPEDRQKFCNLHKDNLSGRFHGLTTSAQNIQDHITAVYAKGQAFVTDKNLQPVDYAGLTATADTAKATSATAISALVAPTLDCTSTTVATDVATFKVSAKAVRDDLGAYRDAVKNVMSAIKVAAKATAPAPTKPADTPTSTTEGAN
jgi:hypothetical protein